MAERFQINLSEAIVDPLPGMLVCIDPNDPGSLKICQESNNPLVAGIIAGGGNVDSGLVMGQSGTLANGEYPVAITGRVYVWADSSDGAIHPGDLLTSSKNEGHVMAVQDISAAQGAIIGKAMTPLTSGQGLILILISLQ